MSQPFPADLAQTLANSDPASIHLLLHKIDQLSQENASLQQQLVDERTKKDTVPSFHSSEEAPHQAAHVPPHESTTHFPNPVSSMPPQHQISPQGATSELFPYQNYAQQQHTSPHSRSHSSSLSMTHPLHLPPQGPLPYGHRKSCDFTRTFPIDDMDSTANGEPISPSRHLWVGNIPLDITEEEIYSEFEMFGEIESVRVLRKKHCAFINFKLVEAAARARQLRHGTMLKSKQIRIKFQDAAKGSESAPTRHLWVGSVGPDVGEDEIRNLFSRYGLLDSVRILHQTHCAFVNFVHLRDAIAAKEALHGTLLGRQRIFIDYSGSGKPSGPAQIPPINPASALTVVRMRGLPFNASQHDIKHFFYGLELAENGIHVAMAPTGPNKSVMRATGEAYVEFQTVPDALQALTRNGQYMGTRYIELFSCATQPPQQGQRGHTHSRLSTQFGSAPSSPRDSTPGVSPVPSPARLSFAQGSGPPPGLPIPPTSTHTSGTEAPHTHTQSGISSAPLPIDRPRGLGVGVGVGVGVGGLGGVIGSGGGASNVARFLGAGGGGMMGLMGRGDAAQRKRLGLRPPHMSAHLVGQAFTQAAASARAPPPGMPVRPAHTHTHTHTQPAEDDDVPALPPYSEGTDPLSPLESPPGDAAIYSILAASQAPSKSRSNSEAAPLPRHGPPTAFRPQQAPSTPLSNTTDTSACTDTGTDTPASQNTDASTAQQGPHPGNTNTSTCTGTSSGRNTGAVASPLAALSSSFRQSLSIADIEAEIASHSPALLPVSPPTPKHRRAGSALLTAASGQQAATEMRLPGSSVLGEGTAGTADRSPATSSPPGPGAASSLAQVALPSDIFSTMTSATATATATATTTTTTGVHGSSPSSLSSTSSAASLGSQSSSESASSRAHGHGGSRSARSSVSQSCHQAVQSPSGSTASDAAPIRPLRASLGGAPFPSSSSSPGNHSSGRPASKSLGAQQPSQTPIRQHSRSLAHVLHMATQNSPCTVPPSLIPEDTPHDDRVSVSVNAMASASPPANSPRPPMHPRSPTATATATATTATTATTSTMKRLSVSASSSPSPNSPFASPRNSISSRHDSTSSPRSSLSSPRTSVSSLGGSPSPPGMGVGVGVPPFYSRRSLSSSPSHLPYFQSPEDVNAPQMPSSSLSVSPGRASASSPTPSTSSLPSTADGSPCMSPTAASPPGSAPASARWSRGSSPFSSPSPSQSQSQSPPGSASAPTSPHYPQTQGGQALGLPGQRPITHVHSYPQAQAQAQAQSGERSRRRSSGGHTHGHHGLYGHGHHAHVHTQAQAQSHSHAGHYHYAQGAQPQRASPSPPPGPPSHSLSPPFGRVQHPLAAANYPPAGFRGGLTDDGRVVLTAHPDSFHRQHALTAPGGHRHTHPYPHNTRPTHTHPNMAPGTAQGHTHHTQGGAARPPPGYGPDRTHTHYGHGHHASPHTHTHTHGHTQGHGPSRGGTPMPKYPHGGSPTHQHQPALLPAPGNGNGNGNGNGASLSPSQSHAHNGCHGPGQGQGHSGQGGYRYHPNGIGPPGYATQAIYNGNGNGIGSQGSNGSVGVGVGVGASTVHRQHSAPIERRRTEGSPPDGPVMVFSTTPLLPSPPAPDATALSTSLQMYSWSPPTLVPAESPLEPSEHLRQPPSEPARTSISAPLVTPQLPVLPHGGAHGSGAEAGAAARITHTQASGSGSGSAGATVGAQRGGPVSLPMAMPSPLRSPQQGQASQVPMGTTPDYLSAFYR